MCALILFSRLLGMLESVEGDMLSLMQEKLAWSYFQRLRPCRESCTRVQSTSYPFRWSGEECNLTTGAQRAELRLP